MIIKMLKNCLILNYSHGLFYIYSRNLRTKTKIFTKTNKLPLPSFEKRLDVVIMGLPNAGKSVLLNTLLKQKLAAISHKKHTTRREILGVFNYRHTQLAFYDTPGYIQNIKGQMSKEDLQRHIEIIHDATEKADVILLVVDSVKAINDQSKLSFADLVKIGFKNVKKELILVLNKVDLIEPKRKLLEITRNYVSIINGIKLDPIKANEAILDTTTFMISGLENDGVLDLKNYLLSIAEVKPWIIPSSQGFTKLTMKQRVEQIVLEALLEHTHEEIPYIAEIVCTNIIRQSSMSRIQVHVTIKVDTPSQQRICLGYQGRTMLKIRQRTSDTLEKLFLQQVVLVHLNIAVDSNNDDEEEEKDNHDEKVYHPYTLNKKV